MVKTKSEFISEIETRVRPTVCSTHRFVDGEHEETLEGRISAVDLECLLSFARIADEEERAHIKTIEQRDAYHDWADKLADAAADHFGEEIGEHSNLNNPWENALELFPAAPQEAQDE